MSRKFTNWKDFEQELNFTSEENAEMQLEMDLISATIEARKKANLSQRELSNITGMPQSTIARIENCTRSPHTSTLIKILHPIGYTIRVVPLSEVPTIKREKAK